MSVLLFYDVLFSSEMEMPALLLLGVGKVAQAVVAASGGGRRIIGTTRQPMRIFELFHESIEPIVMPWPSAEVIEPFARAGDVLVSFPPDGSTDAILAPACLHSRSVVYISSTSVYGSREGTIDDQTPIDDTDQQAVLRIEAEKIWRSVGANVLRAPGIYGPTFGLHKRLKDGSFRLPGDGTRMSSRIHVDDLASLVLALFASSKQGETYVVGDLHPAPHAELAGWLCQKLGFPMPEAAPLESVHRTLRANRAVDPSRALEELHVKLKYPTYKEGYSAILAAEPAE